MPDITQQRMGEILRRVFELLWFEPEGLPVHVILDCVQKTSQLSEYEKGYFPFSTSSPRYEVLLRVATVPLVKAGWLVKTPKGRWYLTDKGRKASKQYSNAEQFLKRPFVNTENGRKMKKSVYALSIQLKNMKRKKIPGIKLRSSFKGCPNQNSGT